jgi:hypothetical protein
MTSPSRIIYAERQVVERRIALRKAALELALCDPSGKIDESGDRLPPNVKIGDSVEWLRICELDGELCRYKSVKAHAESMRAGAQMKLRDYREAPARAERNKRLASAMRALGWINDAAAFEERVAA